MNRQNNIRLIFVFASLAALLLSVGIAQAKAPKKANKPAIVKLQGTLSATLDEKNRVTAIEVADDSGEIYNIVLNKKSKKQAKKLNGKKVKITGKLNAKMSEKKGGKWLVVKKMKPVKPRAGA